MTLWTNYKKFAKTIFIMRPLTQIARQIKQALLEPENEYRTVLPAYERTEEPTERTVGGRLAYSYVYHTTVDGVKITTMQTLFTRDSKIYSFTYTALDENFALHLDDVNAMLDAFTFR